MRVLGILCLRGKRASHTEGKKMTTMTNTQIFVLAHQIARATKTAAGSYRIAFACALKDIYAGIVGQKTTEQKLRDMGFSPWTKNDHKRIYVNVEDLGKIAKIEVDMHNSGRVAQMWIDGYSIKSTRAQSIARQGCFYDCKSSTWHADSAIIDNLTI